MKTLVDPHQALSQGLAEIRTRFKVPDAFPPEVLAAAEAAAQRKPTAHVDRTERAFVTLDPAASIDLDQAFAIEARGSDLILHYAIADVGWFVRDGDPLDVEAWKRGATLYLPDGKASLYPRVLSEGAASLLPSGPRPAVVFTVRVAPDGEPTLEGAERALIRRAHARAISDIVHGRLRIDTVGRRLYCDERPVELTSKEFGIAELLRRLAAHGIDPDDPSSFLLVDGDRAWKDSDAIRRVVGGLGGVWRCAHLQALLPRGFRDRVYRLVARNRYRLFGRRDVCVVPSPEDRARFLG